MANRPAEVLIVDLSPEIRRLIAKRITMASPTTPVHVAADLPAARQIMAEHDMIRVIAMGSLVRGQDPVTDETIRFIRAATGAHSPISVIGATSIADNAKAMLAAGCRVPIVEQKAQWHLPILADLDVYARAIEDF